MKKEHKYAQVLRWIADGEDVQGKIAEGPWADLKDFNSEHSSTILKGDPHPFSSYEFRLKPRTITVNGREIAAGAKKPPRSKTTCYLPQLYLDGLVSSFTWSGSISNISAMKKGLVHLDRENAIAHAKAMLGID